MLLNTRFHDLRQSATSILLEIEVHSKIVADMLGHSRIDVTMDIYSHATPALHKSAAEKIEEALFGANEPMPPVRRRRRHTTVRIQPWFGPRGYDVMFDTHLIRSVALDRRSVETWCRRRDSNPHGPSAQRILSPPCLPFHHSGTRCSMLYP